MNSESIEAGSPSWISTHVIGRFISFDIEQWDDHGRLFFIRITSKVLRVVKDPLGRHETKCFVNIEGEDYGIPLSEIVEYKSKDGQQLELF